MFVYTPEEKEHLQDIILHVVYLKTDEESDPDYWRFMADSAKGGLFASDYPDEEDVFAPTEADMIEIAESLECGMDHGEFI